MTELVWKCNACGGRVLYGHQHYCLVLPRTPGAEPSRQFTEADIRRIVREEIAKGTTEGSKT